MMAQATAIKARPFICTAEEVRGILGGEISQLRRPLALQPKGPVAWCGSDGMWRWGQQHQFPSKDDFEIGLHCPHGGPGDQLWVRETWFHMPEDWVVYKADPGSEGFEGTPWRSPLYMPRWAARILLEVAAIRVERPGDTGPWMWAIEVRRIEP